jgi:hypothetical protein
MLSVAGWTSERSPSAGSVRRLSDDVVCTGGALGGGAQDSVGGVWPAFAESVRANGVHRTRGQEGGYVLWVRPRLGTGQETRADSGPSGTGV